MSDELDRYVNALIKIQCICSVCLERTVNKGDVQRIMDAATEALTPRHFTAPAPKFEDGLHGETI